jgi:hypothetical protein
LMILMKQLEIHLMNSLNFYRKHGGGFVEDVKKSVAFRKPTLIEITNLTLL